MLRWWLLAAALSAAAPALAAFYRAELAKWAKIVKDSGAKLD